MRYLAPTCLVLLFSIATSCSDDSSDTIYDIDSELAPYVDRFVEAAADQDRYIDLRDYSLSAHIETAADEVAGQCVSYTNGAHRIYIDPEYWVRATDLEREFVVFHELGHCVLGRSHVDTADDRGLCQSIMTSGLGECRIVYTATTRDDFLIELFDE